MNGHGTRHKSGRIINLSFSDFFYRQERIKQGVIAIKQEKNTHLERELLREIDAFKRKKLTTSINIKRSEIEQWVEIAATSLSIEYKKEPNSTNTIYHFYIEGRQSQLKVFFRYGIYYTLHQIIE